MAELKQQRETPVFPNLEIYGHWHSDEAKCETIIIGLQLLLACNNRNCQNKKWGTQMNTEKR